MSIIILWRTKKRPEKSSNFLRRKKQPELKLFLLDKYSETADLKEAQKLMKEGVDFGLLSEAGLPCIGDPGNIMVGWSHNNNIKVIPVNGPSSFVLALIASGFNGQQFSFHGYLPIDKEKKKKKFRTWKMWLIKQDSHRFLWKHPIVTINFWKIWSNS
jgi:16S rRNA C1402 (ribose-2'-O) methylase RsmI